MPPLVPARTTQVFTDLPGAAEKIPISVPITDELGIELTSFLPAPEIEITSRFRTAPEPCMQYAGPPFEVLAWVVAITSIAAVDEVAALFELIDMLVHGYDEVV